MADIAENINIHGNKDRKLISKLQTIALHEHLQLNTLAKQLLHKRADQLIEEFGIEVMQSGSVS